MAIIRLYIFFLNYEYILIYKSKSKKRGKEVINV